MFQKKQMIYSETLGVCRVENIVQLAVTKNDVPAEYYVLKPLFGEKTAAYIPTHNHAQVLRELFTREEALALKEAGIPEQNIQLRKAVDYVLNDSANR